MAEEKEFDKALESLKNSFAGKDGIIHLYEQGYSLSRIQSSLDFPFSMERIGRTIWDHCISTERILLKAPESGIGKENATYIKKTGAYGRQSFIKVDEPASDGRLSVFTKAILNVHHDIFTVSSQSDKGMVRKFISEHSSGGPDYVSVDFGRIKTRAGNEWAVLLAKLSDEDKEYAEYLPWEKSINSVYHILDDRILSILDTLEGSGSLPGVYYFAAMAEN